MQTLTPTLPPQPDATADARTRPAEATPPAVPARPAPPLPRALRLVLIACCAAVAATAVAGAVGAVALMSRPAWTLFGFELVVAAVAVQGVIYVRSNPRRGLGLGLACIAGAIVAGSVLGFVSVRMALGEVPLLIPAAARIAAGGLLAGTGAWAVLRTNPKSWVILSKGLAAGAPAVIALGLFAGPTGRPFRAWAGEVSGVVTFVGGTIVGLVLIGLVSASVHLVIRAFQLGAEPER